MMLSAGNGFIMQSDKYSRYNAGQSLKKYILLKKGELAYNHGASKAKQFGCCYELLEDEALIPYVYHCFKVDKNEYTPYVAFLLNNPKIDRQLKRLVSSSARMDGLLNISFKDYMSINLSLPPYAEQKQVSDFIKRIDERIVIQEQLISSLKKYKRGSLSALFPKKGEITPQYRFAGFTKPWEQRKLNEITDVRDGTHDSPKYVQEGHPFITSKNVSNGFINYDDVQYVTDEDYEKINKRSKVDVHDILMGMIGTIGNLALIRKKPDFAIKNVALIKYTGDIEYKYLYQALQADCVTSQLSTGMDGGTQKFVSLKKIRELDIPFPEECEQKKIGAYFSNLDTLITLHQHKYDILLSLKNALLQQLFI